MYSLHSLTLGSDLTSFLMMGSSVVVTVWKIRSMRCIGFSFFTFTLKNKIKPCSISPSFAEFMDFYGLLQKIFVYSKAPPPPALTSRPSTSLLLPRPAAPAKTPSFTETLAANLSALAEMVKIHSKFILKIIQHGRH